MNIKYYFSKKVIKKNFLGIILPHFLTFLFRRKSFNIKYQNICIKLTSLLFYGDIMYHHFHAYYRSKANFSTDKWERLNIDLSSGATLYIDIGGYNGIFRLLAAKNNPNIKVHIFEPNLLSAYVIHRNIILNDIKNINLHHAAVGKATGVVPISINKNGTRVQTKNEINFLKVNCLAIDSLINSFADKDFENVVVKIDSEGFEKQCLEGMEQFIKKCKRLNITLTIHSKIISSYGYTEKDFYDTEERLELKLIDSERFSEGVELQLQKH